MKQTTPMEAHLSISQTRIDVILKIIKDFFNEVPINSLQERFQELLGGKISPSEFALAEQKIKNYGISDTDLKNRLEDLIAIFKSSFETVSIDSLPAGHPIDTFTKENKAIKKLITEMRRKEANIDFNAIDADWWNNAYNQIQQIIIHYVRKENQLFPYLEQKGFDKPSTVMWALHDDIRNLIKFYSNLLQDGNYEELFSMQELLFSSIEDMIFKEEKILWPTSLDLLTQKEWVEIRKGEDEVGYCLIQNPPVWTPEWSYPSENKIKNKSSKKAPAVQFNPSQAHSPTIGDINLEVGSITPEQINLIFKHLPFDITYINEFDKICYYNNGEEGILPRSSDIVGKQIKYYFPHSSIHSVEKIIDEFKKGKRDRANFKINFHNKYFDIQYFAVRNEGGYYKGVLEVVYNTQTVIRSEEKQHLINWK